MPLDFLSFSFSFVRFCDVAFCDCVRNSNNLIVFYVCVVLALRTGLICDSFEFNAGSCHPLTTIILYVYFIWIPQGKSNRNPYVMMCIDRTD